MAAPPQAPGPPSAPGTQPAPASPSAPPSPVAPAAPKADAGVVAPAAVSKYWTSETKVHRVVFPGVIDANFNFTPTGANGKSGTVDGQGVAFKHNGKYEILSNKPEDFRMKVTIGTKDNPTEDMDATLSIGKEGATVSGMVEGKKANTPRPLPVSGNGTESNPFRVVFSEAELVWYLL